MIKQICLARTRDKVLQCLITIMLMKYSIFPLALFFLLPHTLLGVPRLEVYWDSRLSYEYTGVDAPWHINLDEIDVGVPGYLGPNVVAILAS